jgi:hypothetical protein
MKLIVLIFVVGFACFTLVHSELPQTKKAAETLNKVKNQFTDSVPKSTVCIT